MHTIVASHFQAGAILTLVMPVGGLIAVGIYWGVLLRRRSEAAEGGNPE
jgi:hypothetical protein